MLMNAVQAKLLSMLVIGAGSFIVGIAPSCFVRQTQDLQRKLLLSCTLCFGGGVLFATAVLHVLPEVKVGLPDHAELVFCCGFLLLYFIDETVHYFWGGDVEHTPDVQREGTSRDRGGRCRGHSHQAGCTATTQSVRNARMPDHGAKLPYQSNVPGNGTARTWSTTYGAMQFTSNAPTPSCGNEEGTFLCHGNHTEPCAGINTGLVGLLLALTVHAVLEGLAIGLQKEPAEVLLLMGAVASHKFVVGFCLGLELAGAGSTILKLILAIFVFSSGSALGIGAGMLTFEADKAWSEVALPILQGLAGGTLLYVTVSEVFPRERARWHRSTRRSAGILQFLCVAVGFVLIYLLNNYVGT